MIGDTPQPGDTPRSEGDPWSFGDPDAAWWRGETDRTTEASDGRPRHPRRRPSQGQGQPAAGGTGTLLPPGHDRVREGAAAEAHAAGTRDVGEELDPDVARRSWLPELDLLPVEAEPPVVAEPPVAEPPKPAASALIIETVGPQNLAAQAESPVVERDHDQPDARRYDPLRPPAGYTAKVAAATVAADDEAAPIEPDVMILPEPNPRNRPTVVLDRGSVPGQPPAGRRGEPLPPPTGQPHTDARLEKLENSPFWRDRADDTIEVGRAAGPAHTAVRSHRGQHPGRRLPLSAHVSLVVLGLIAAFFGWVSAEPFWIAVGHGDAGYATTTSCTGSGMTQRCVGQFAAADGRFRVDRITLLGVGQAGRAPGSVAPARVVNPDSRQAYLDNTGTLLHLRWIAGFVLILICGYAVAGVTRARRLETARARRAAILLSMAGPLALLAGFLLAAY